MQNQYETVISLTSQQALPKEMLRSLASDFAYLFGWRPSDLLEVPSVADIATAHLVVEHGLENTAVISFLDQNRKYSDLNLFEQRRLLSVSYNNLIDWHINVEADHVTYVFNRTRTPAIVDEYSLSRQSIDRLRIEAFDILLGKRPNPNVPALDDALIDTISFWKRELGAIFENNVSNSQLSALFNAIIFARATEDHLQRSRTGATDEALLDIWRATSTKTIRSTIQQCLARFGISDAPDNLISEGELQIFDTLDEYTVSSLFTDFYRNKYAPYPYDFSLMSKHALSRIYEHYVSVLRLEDSSASPQLRLPSFTQLPEEERNKAFGSVYTPEFIARFFAKYLRLNLPSHTFRRLKAIDPAVGSGIFIRTILELQFEFLQESVDLSFVKEAIQNVYGLDIDENAAHATRLSLSLLHLVLTDRLPDNLKIYVTEAIGFYNEHPDFRDAFDVVIANPPFVALEAQDNAMRSHVATFMAGYAKGRIDTYLAFLKLAVEMLKPGGYGMFVLPHSFLLSDSARGMRELISKSSYIRCLADLSAIRVFGSSGIYVVLLIFQKKNATGNVPPATIVKCQDLVGPALQDVLDNQKTENNFYSIYDVPQSTFEQHQWTISPPTEAAIERKLSSLSKLSDFMEVKEGFVSGADNVFIVSQEDIPANDEVLFVHFLPDREMESYTVPATTRRFFFYPYINGRKISEDELRNDFPNTWNYLNQHKKSLQARGAVSNTNALWWMPTRPRQPENMLRPKIVSPHLVLLPRFSLDKEGRYSISHSPMMYPKKTGAEDDLLHFFVALLNSTPCFWYISTHSHKYQRGYVMLEPKTLKTTPVPDPAKIGATQLKRFLDLVDRRLAATDNLQDEVEKEIDTMAADFYGLTTHERQALGME